MRFASRNILTSLFFFALICTSLQSIASSHPDSARKKEFTIAFILPFNTSKVYISDLEQSKYYFPDETQIAAEFLQGALLAVDSLKQLGLNAKIQVYDAGNDSSTIDIVLKRPSLKESDLIFAPFNGYALKAATEFASREQIPVISPFSVSFSAADSNRFLILANASMKTHCERLYDYMITTALTHRTLMVYRKRPEDLEIVNYFKKYAAEKKKAGNSVLKFVEITDSTKTNYSKLKDSLFTTDENQILIPSIDEPFVRTMMKQLTNLQSDYKIRVYGMPTWNSFELIPGKQLDSLKAVITSSFWLDKSAEDAENFKKKYATKYEVNPSAYSVRGFDEAFYFISELMKHDSLLENLPTENSVTLLATSYNFTPDDYDSGKGFLENRSLILLERKEGKWVPVKD